MELTNSELKLAKAIWDNIPWLCICPHCERDIEQESQIPDPENLYHNQNDIRDWHNTYIAVIEVVMNQIRETMLKELQ